MKQSWAASTWRGAALRLLIVVFGSYLAIIMLLMWFENALVYHPTSAAAHWSPPPSADVHDVVLATEDGGEIHSWWLPCPGSDGALLYLHGNAGNLSHRGET